jgi:enoyl-CoA hydratase/carnithine racemase
MTAALPKPTIAMIGGLAVGAGFSLADASDPCYASDAAVFIAGFALNGPHARRTTSTRPRTRLTAGLAVRQ